MTTFDNTYFAGCRAVFRPFGLAGVQSCRIRKIQHRGKQLVLYHYYADEKWRPARTLKRLELTRRMLLIVFALPRDLKRMDPRGRFRRFLSDNRLEAAYLDEDVTRVDDHQPTILRVIDPQHGFVEVTTRVEEQSIFPLRFSGGSLYNGIRLVGQREIHIVSSWIGSSWVHKKPQGFQP